MSKVKQQIEDAGEFAKKTQTPEEARESYVERRDQSFLRDDNQDGIVYSSEQELRNIEVKQAVATVNETRLAVIDHHKAEVSTWKEEVVTDVSRVDVMHVFNRDFLITSKDKEASPKEVKEELSLMMEPDKIFNLQSVNNENTQLLLVQAPSHLYAPCEDKRGKGLGIYLHAIKPLSERLLEDKEITDSLLCPYKVLGATDIFVMLRQELLHADDDIAKVRGTIGELESKKGLAIAKEDLEEAEKLTFEQLALHTIALEKHRGKLQNVFASHADVEYFQENYETTRDNLDSVLAAHTTKIKENLDSVTGDIDLAQRAQDKRYQEMLEAEEAHDAWLLESKQRLDSFGQRNAALWNRISDVFEELTPLHSEWAAEMAEQVSRVEAETVRKAKEDYFLTGLESYAKVINDGRASLEVSLSWLDQLKDFAAKTSDVIEGKKVAEEAVDIRVGAQLDYLEDYRVFKQQCDDLLEKLASRTTSLGRLQRSLEFQVKEALTTLDPNTKKYKVELVDIEAQIKETGIKMDLLSQQSKKEATMWQPTEEQLEDAQIDFTPPDIEADKKRCEVKTKNVGSSRKFVSGEQERVDKATMELRRFKTSNQIAVEGASKRRQEKVAQIEAAPAPVAPAVTDSGDVPPREAESKEEEVVAVPAPVETATEPQEEPIA